MSWRSSLRAALRGGLRCLAGVIPVNGHTHILGGLLVGAAVVQLAGQTGPHLLPFLVVAALAAPLPDVDHPESMYGRFVPLPGVAKVNGSLEPYRSGPFGNGGKSFGHVGRRLPGGILWHRGPTHSLVMAGVFGAMAYYVAGHFAPGLAWTVGLGVLLGCLSHLALDELNVAGERLLWPLWGKEARLRWPSFRVGSAWETVLFVAMAGAVFLLLRGEVGLLGPHLFARQTFRKGW